MAQLSLSRQQLPPGGIVQASAASGLDAFVRAQGGDPAAPLARAGLSADTLDDPQRVIPLSRYAALLEEASRETASPAFGLEFARVFEPTHLGPVGHLLSRGRTLGSALDTFGRFFAALQSNTRVELTLSDGVACMRYQVEEAQAYERAQDAEFSIAFLVDFCRGLAGARWRCHGVAFEHGPRAEVSYHGAYFDAPVRFLQRTNAFFFPVTLLDLPNPGADPLLTDFLERHLAEALRDQRARADLVGRAEAAVVAALRRADDIAPEALAASLGISVRTLQRRFDEAGSSFSEVRAAARLALARDYLADGGATVTEIALRLGYSETSAFSRAFKAATGESPLAFRRRVMRDD